MIHLSTTSNVINILIEDSITLDDEKTFEEQIYLHQGSYFVFNITMLHIKSVSSKMVDALDQIKDQMELVVSEESLSYYLRVLGIDNKFKNLLQDDIVEYKSDIKAIVIGGSAGSLDHIIDIVGSLPYVDISVFVVMHILPIKKSSLVSILRSHTKYKVKEATSGLVVEPNCIYVAMPDTNMMVYNGHINIDRSIESNFARPSINITLQSLCYEYENHELMAILLCGYGRDGSKYLKELIQNKHTVLIQNPQECVAKDMLNSAIETKNFTKVLSLDNIKNYISSSLKPSVDEENTFCDFLDKIYAIYGYDFRNYDTSSLNRRIDFIMHQNHIDSFEKFKTIIFKDHKIFEKLLRGFSINVTTFFRNPTLFDALKEDVVEELRSYPTIKVWCAGCSRGDEPYSLAILLEEMGLLHRTEIYATDFNATILQEAKNGIFPIGEYNKFESNYRQSGGVEDFQKYFTMRENYIEIESYLKEHIYFFEHNLVSDDSINEFNLIFCRNVIIYFDKYLQKKVFRTIDRSLRRDGFLVLGESEAFDLKNYNYTQKPNKGIKEMKIYNKGKLWK